LASLAWSARRSLGSSRVIILARVVYPFVWLVVAIAPATTVADALLFLALFLQGLAAGIENSKEMGYWQALTPDELLGPDERHQALGKSDDGCTRSSHCRASWSG
jgi:hypothetical protein